MDWCIGRLLPSRLSAPSAGQVMLFFFNYPGKEEACASIDERAVSGLIDLLTPAERRHFTSVLARPYAVAGDLKWSRSQVGSILSRAAVRLVLAMLLFCEPWQVPLAISDRGKLYLKGSPYFINLSHSNNLGVLAVASCNLGIDLEFLGRAVAMRCGLQRQILQKTLQLADEQALERLIGGQNCQFGLANSACADSDSRRLFAWWTIYESVVKYYAAGVWRCDRFSAADRQAIWRKLQTQGCRGWLDEIAQKADSAHLVKRIDLANSVVEWRALSDATSSLSDREEVMNAASAGDGDDIRRPVNLTDPQNIYQFSVGGQYLGAMTVQHPVTAWRAYALDLSALTCQSGALVAPVSVMESAR